MLNRAGKYATGLMVSLGKKAVHAPGKMLVAVLWKTAPLWLPLTIILGLAYGSFVVIYVMPREAVEEAALGTLARIAAFLGVAEDDQVARENADLFTRYQSVAARWDEGLNEIQQGQIEVFRFSWAILAAVDRVVNDPLVSGRGREKIRPDPEAVFNQLQPVFDWKDSVVTIEEEVEVVRKEKDGNDMKDKEGNKITETVTVETIENIKLLNHASTIEGLFTYHYRMETELDNDGRRITRKVIDRVDYPAVYYLPLAAYLKARGIANKSDIQLVLELAAVYDREYELNVTLRKNMDYQGYPTVKGYDDWLWPTPSRRITSPFGPRTNPYVGFHRGVDIGATRAGIDGDPVWAMDDGVVVFAGWAGGYGRVVYIDHGEQRQTRHAHLSNILVSTGDWVRRGDVIGLMGNTGRSLATHLHFELLLGGVQYDPVFYFPVGRERN